MCQTLVHCEDCPVVDELILHPVHGMHSQRALVAFEKLPVLCAGQECKPKIKYNTFIMAAIDGIVKVIYLTQWNIKEWLTDAVVKVLSIFMYCTCFHKSFVVTND